jgi:hypothetical protein
MVEYEEFKNNYPKLWAENFEIDFLYVAKTAVKFMTSILKFDN